MIGCDLLSLHQFTINPFNLGVAAPDPVVESDERERQSSGCFGKGVGLSIVGVVVGAPAAAAVAAVADEGNT